METNNIIEELIRLALSLSAGDLVKFIFVSLSFLYIFFAFAVWRQVQLMASVVEAGDTTLLKTISIVHFLGAILLFALAFILL